MYHLQIPDFYVRKMEVFNRKFHIERFVEQKQKENEAMEKERKKGRH